MPRNYIYAKLQLILIQQVTANCFGIMDVEHLSSASAESQERNFFDEDVRDNVASSDEVKTHGMKDNESTSRSGSRGRSRSRSKSPRSSSTQRSRSRSLTRNQRSRSPRRDRNNRSRNRGRNGGSKNESRALYVSGFDSSTEYVKF